MQRYTTSDTRVVNWLASKIRHLEKRMDLYSQARTGTQLNPWAPAFTPQHDVILDMLERQRPSSEVDAKQKEELDLLTKEREVAQNELRETNVEGEAQPQHLGSELPRAREERTSLSIEPQEARMSEQTRAQDLTAEVQKKQKVKESVQKELEEARATGELQGLKLSADPKRSQEAAEAQRQDCQETEPQEARIIEQAHVRDSPFELQENQEAKEAFQQKLEKWRATDVVQRQISSADLRRPQYAAEAQRQEHQETRSREEARCQAPSSDPQLAGREKEALQRWLQETQVEGERSIQRLNENLAQASLQLQQVEYVLEVSRLNGFGLHVHAGSESHCKGQRAELEAKQEELGHLSDERDVAQPGEITDSGTTHSTKAETSSTSIRSTLRISMSSTPDAARRCQLLMGPNKSTGRSCKHTPKPHGQKEQGLTRKADGSYKTS